MINETNYHLFLDDFVNGLLDEEMEMDFVAFLDKHPNILEDESLDKFEAELPANFKSGLKKEIPVTERSTDEMLVAAMEGDLSPKEEAELAVQIAATPSLQQEKALFALTRLEADMNIKFPNKSGLRKRPVIVLYARWASAVAAVFILGLLLFRFFLGTGIPQQNPEARVNPEITRPEQTPLITIPSEEDKKIQTAMNGAEEQNVPEKSQEEDFVTYQKQEPLALINKPLSIGAPQQNGFADLAMLEENIEKGIEKHPTASHEQSVWEWAYKKVRARVGEAEIMIPEKEIPRDAANLVLARVAPVFQYNQTDNGSSIRIGGLEFNRQSTQ